MRNIISILTLLALWLLMSGIYKPMVIGFGVASALIAVWFVRRMDTVDGHQLAYRLNIFRLTRYLGWLLVEVAKTNIAVTKLILQPNAKLRQNLFAVNNTQKTELGAVLFANSITLTPGTITVEVEPSRFWVHAADFSDADPEALADMDARVTAVEGRT